MSEERLVWSGTASQIVNLGAFLLWGVLALTLVLAPVSVGVILWKYLVVKNRIYELTSQRLKMHVGVFSKTTSELELYRIKDTQFEQPFFLRLFGLGNVLLISTDATTPIVKIEAIANAHELRENIRKFVEERRDAKRVRNIEME
jgi:uncharacterized membrane protein YdbT with pleckstrin-like domain